MTEPWPNGSIHSDAIDPLENPIVQRDAARELAAVLAERNDRALNLHKPFLDTNNGGAHWRCTTCRGAAPCRTRRALTGADEDGAA